MSPAPSLPLAGGAVTARALACWARAAPAVSALAAPGQAPSGAGVAPKPQQSGATGAGLVSKGGTGSPAEVRPPEAHWPSAWPSPPSHLWPQAWGAVPQWGRGSGETPPPRYQRFWLVLKHFTYLSFF